MCTCEVKKGKEVVDIPSILWKTDGKASEGQTPCDSGVSAVLEYLITFVVAFIIFTMVVSMFDSMFIRGPTDAVSQVQFADLGNDVSAKLLDTYLIVPESGNVNTTFQMPDAVAGHSYKLKITGNIMGDEEVSVSSTYSSIDTVVTINGIGYTIPISGSTDSVEPIHLISYQSW